MINKPHYHVSLGAGLTIPMGNKPTGEFIFEAIRGNGCHKALGGDVTLNRRIFGDYEHNLSVNVSAHYRYLFTTQQQRTLGLIGRPFGQHYLLGKNGSPANTPLTPAANILTLPVDVTGRSQYDSIVGFTYTYNWFTMDLGYNFYYRDAELVRQRSSFPDNTWAVASRGFSVGNDPFNFNANPFDGFDGGTLAHAIVNDTTINTNASATPSQATHALYANLGYLFGCKSPKRRCGVAYPSKSSKLPWPQEKICKKNEYSPWMLSTGGKYEWTHNNNALEHWTVWIKAGVGF